MRTVFIGDIHGCAAELADLLEATDFAPNEDHLLLTGDAFSRGPLPLEVWDILTQTDAIMVLGNHDERLLKQLLSTQQGRIPDFNWPDQQRTYESLLTVADDLLPWLVSLPLYICDRGFLLVHAGVNPHGGYRLTTHKQFLTIRTWPPTDDFSAPRWHDFYVPKQDLLVFGHDAPGGLVVKRRPEGDPYLLGLDSGCVYGGRLTAYILEERRIVQVVSRQR